MSTTLPAAPVDLDEIAHSIAQSYPDLGFQRIRGELDEIAPRYVGATVTDFLPVLFAREVRARLRAR